MVQVRLSVVSLQNGSMNAVAGSGIASMSEASMLFQPRIDDPSKPKPSSNTSAVSSAIGTVKCCHVPNVSTNFASTIFTPCFFAISITLFAVLMLVSRLRIRLIGYVATKKPRHSPGWRGNSNRLLARFLGADADRVLDRAHENFSVADLAVLRGFDDRRDGRRHLRIRDDDIEFDLGQEIHGVFAAAIDFRVPLLPPEPLHF